MSTFLFCIGGTGLRVMKSLTMLLASGYKACNEKGESEDIIPVLIDPHKSLDEFTNCKKSLDRYCEIRSMIARGALMQDNFFHTRIVSLGNLGANNDENSNFDYDLRLDCSFGEFIKKSKLPTDSVSQDLINLLYSESNINRSLAVGFKGSPNVGCVVLNNFEDQNWFQDLTSKFGQGDKIFIVASVFGGTGASGFPLLVKKIRSCGNAYLQNASIGAIAVMPYFELTPPKKEDPNNDINSSCFITKTKAALSYYDKELKVDSLYYIADDKQQKPYTNDEELQKNGTHFIEFMAATSVFHYIKSTPAEQNKMPDDRKTEYYSICIDNNSEVMNWDNIGMAHQEYIYSLLNYYTFSMVNQLAKGERDFPLRKTSGFDDTFHNSGFFLLLDEFNGEFYKWLHELSDNDRAFAPFLLEGNNVLKSFPLQGHEFTNTKRCLWSKIPYGLSYYLHEMILLEKKYKKRNMDNLYQKYTEMMYEAIDNINKFIK